MKKNGFTLVELLAVIVILAIISLIAVPKILNVVEDAKKGAAESSAFGYIEAIRQQSAYNRLEDDKTKRITEGIYTIAELSEKDVKVRGQAIDDGWVQIGEDGNVIDCSFKVGEYYVNPKDNNVNKLRASKTGELRVKPSSYRITIIAPETGETHKGIVYLDPTDLTKTCTAEDVATNVNDNGTPTEIKTGCMKWYIYSEDKTNNTYTMILDHNTTAKVQWYTSDSNVAYASSLVKPYVDALTSTNKWKVNPRLISANEIKTITGNTSFDLGTANWYCLGSNTKDSPSSEPYCNKDTNKKYAWLYDYLYDGITYGANYNDNSTYALANNTATIGGTYAYWTSDTVGTAGYGSYVWSGYRDGSLGNIGASNTDRGVRPVIELSKSNFNVED